MARMPFRFSIRTTAGTCLVLTAALATGCNTPGAAPTPFSPYAANGKLPGGTPTPASSTGKPMPPPSFPQPGANPSSAPLRMGSAAPVNTSPNPRLTPFDPSTRAPVNNSSPLASVPAPMPVPPAMTSLPTSPLPQSGSLNPNFPTMPPAGARMPDPPNMSRPIASTSPAPALNPVQFPSPVMPQVPDPASAFGAPTGPNAPNLGGQRGVPTSYSTTPAAIQ